MSPKKRAENTVTAPFCVLIDGREKAPYRFTGLRADASKKSRHLVVPTQWAHLKTGDYTIRHLQDTVAVERKSLQDLFSTLGQHRERFEDEHRRLAEMRRAAVIIEASWFDILKFPPGHSRLNPKTVFRTAMSWYVRYGVPWFALEDRRLAEVATFRFLEKAYKEFSIDEPEPETEFSS